MVSLFPTIQVFIHYQMLVLTTNASDRLKVVGDLGFTGRLKVTDLGLSGSNGQFLKSTGAGVTWSSFPTARTSTTANARRTNKFLIYI